MKIPCGKSKIPAPQRKMSSPEARAYVNQKFAPALARLAKK
ncbi:MAG: hypothetical protein JWP03_2239 [Phycisphaerales bacterium]|nr:hypothetical protein [Phycisphaerales bacterium]